MVKPAVPVDHYQGKVVLVDGQRIPLAEWLEKQERENPKPVSETESANATDYEPAPELPPKPAPAPEVIDFEGKTVGQLKLIARERGLKFDNRIKKADLIKLLRGGEEIL